MTGDEFAAAIKAAGYNQLSFAKTMGVHRTRIADRCCKETVEPYWVYALAGLIAVRAGHSIQLLFGAVDFPSLKMTGNQFEAALKASGYTQGAFADLMGVRRNTIGAQYAKNEVELHWIYALAGLVATTAAANVADFVKKSKNREEYTGKS